MVRTCLAITGISKNNLGDDLDLKIVRKLLWDSLMRFLCEDFFGIHYKRPSFDDLLKFS